MKKLFANVCLNGDRVHVGVCRRMERRYRRFQMQAHRRHREIDCLYAEMCQRRCRRGILNLRRQGAEDRQSIDGQSDPHLGHKVTVTGKVEGDTIPWTASRCNGCGRFYTAPFTALTGSNSITSFPAGPLYTTARSLGSPSVDGEVHNPSIGVLVSLSGNIFAVKAAMPETPSHCRHLRSLDDIPLNGSRAGS